MESVFLAYSFQLEDRDLVEQVERLIESHGLMVRKGKALGGTPLMPEIKNRIANSDALVALMTKRDTKDGWPSSPWVRDEFVTALANMKPAIAMIEQGLANVGAYSGNEHISLDRDQPLEAFLSLSETIRTWRETIGRMIEVRLQPDELDRLATEGPNGMVCEYRVRNESEDTPGEWRNVKVFPQVGGVVLLARGIRERQLMQIRFRTQAGEDVWVSKFEPYRMHATLERKKTP